VRQVRHPQESQEIDQIELVGDREGDDVKGSEGTSTLEGAAGPLSQLLLEEETFATDILLLVEETINCLKAQIGYADLVAVRISQGNPEPRFLPPTGGGSASGPKDGASFGFQYLLTMPLELFSH